MQSVMATKRKKKVIVNTVIGKKKKKKNTKYTLLSTIGLTDQQQLGLSLQKHVFCLFFVVVVVLAWFGI